ncbi:MAG TPA: EboA domain-containing protein [Thermodesulfobacteriota bacterium]|nr:EboA domain-containing protein [Thermodesulfobacteriota bacterium]
MSAPPLATLALDLAAARAAPAGRAWLAQAAEAAAGQPFDPERFLALFAAVPRRVGKGPVRLETAERERLAALGAPWPLDEMRVDELARQGLLLLAAAHAPAAAYAAAVDEAYRHGELAERQAVLRALPLLPAPERFLPLATDACRSSIQPVFEAIACENPYPARYFPDLHFNQMVLKALFTGVALSRLVGLPERITPELVRMAADYVAERRAAGRSVPPDAERLIAEGARPR